MLSFQVYSIGWTASFLLALAGYAAVAVPLAYFSLLRFAHNVPVWCVHFMRVIPVLNYYGNYHPAVCVKNFPVGIKRLFITDSVHLKHAHVWNDYKLSTQVWGNEILHTKASIATDVLFKNPKPKLSCWNYTKIRTHSESKYFRFACVEKIIRKYSLSCYVQKNRNIHATYIKLCTLIYCVFELIKYRVYI